MTATTKPQKSASEPMKDVTPSPVAASAVATVADLYARKPTWTHPELCNVEHAIAHNATEQLDLIALIDDLQGKLGVLETAVRAKTQAGDFRDALSDRNATQKLNAEIANALGVLGMRRFTRQQLLRDKAALEELERRANTVAPSDDLVRTGNNAA